MTRPQAMDIDPEEDEEDEQEGQRVYEALVRSTLWSAYGKRVTEGKRLEPQNDLRFEGEECVGLSLWLNSDGYLAMRFITEDVHDYQEPDKDEEEPMEVMPEETANIDDGPRLTSPTPPSPCETPTELASVAPVVPIDKDIMRLPIGRPQFMPKSHSRPNASLPVKPASGQFPVKYKKFIETLLLKWNIEWSIEGLDIEDVDPSLGSSLLFAGVEEVTKYGRPVDVYSSHDHLLFPYIPSLLMETIQTIRRCSKTASTHHSVTLVLKECKELPTYCMIEVRTEVLRRVGPPLYSRGDVVLINFDKNQEKRALLGIIVLVGTVEVTTTEPPKLGQSLLPVIDEYVILANSNVREELKCDKGKPSFKLIFLCNVQSYLFEANSAYEISQSPFLGIFLSPKPFQSYIVGATGRPDPRPALASKRKDQVLQLGASFASNTSTPLTNHTIANSPKILCLTSDHWVKKGQLIQEIIRDAIEAKATTRILFIAPVEKVGEWTQLLSPLRPCPVSGWFESFVEDFRLMDINERQHVLNVNFFDNRRKLLDPHSRGQVLDEINKWLDNSLQEKDMSSLTCFHFDKFKDRTRAGFMQTTPVVIGSLEDLMNDRTFVPFLKKHSLRFDCCLVDEAQRMPEFKTVSLLEYCFSRLLLIGSNQPLGQGRRSLFERFINGKAYIVF